MAEYSKALDSVVRTSHYFASGRTQKDTLCAIEDVVLSAGRGNCYSSNRNDIAIGFIGCKRQRVVATYHSLSA